MAFENPWGKGSSEFDKWFNNPWEVRQTNSGGSTNSALKNKVLNWGPDHWKNSAVVKQDSPPAVSAEQEPDPAWLRYTVKSGETFDFIARKFGLEATGSDLAFWNNMKYNTDPLQPGIILALPYKTEEDLDQIEKDLDEMTAEAEEKGWKVAVDNLNRFRAGTGGVKIMDVAWLKSFTCVIKAITNIQEHFQNALSTVADSMTDGETVNGDGTKKEKGNQYWWEGSIDVPYFLEVEISMACGASTLVGVGVITLVRIDDEVSVTGEVEFQFEDPYDWRPGESIPIAFSWGQAAFFPLSGMPFEEWPDSNMILLDEFRGAAEFNMKASWKQNVRGSISVGFWSNDINLTWTDI